jgi:uncharacterized membrane protein YsdA (DUF1294 family)/cold shock CspA family protein
MIPGPIRTTGVVKTWVDGRGYGFATPVQGGADVFVHVNMLTPDSARPRVGDTLRFEIELSPEGKRRARNVESDRKIEPIVHRTGRLTPRPPGPPPRSGWLGYLAIAGFVGIYVLVDLLRPFPLWVPALYLGASIVCFVAYAVDKAASRRGGWRVPEASLLALGVIGGWPGAIVAQQVFRHKTIKSRFRVAFWLTVLLNLAYFLMLAWLTMDVVI